MNNTKRNIIYFLLIIAGIIFSTISAIFSRLLIICAYSIFDYFGNVIGLKYNSQYIVNILKSLSDADVSISHIYILFVGMLIGILFIIIFEIFKRKIKSIVLTCIIPPSDYMVNEDNPYFEKTTDYKGENHYEETNSVGIMCADIIADTFESLCG